MAPTFSQEQIYCFPTAQLVNIDCTGATAGLSLAVPSPSGKDLISHTAKLGEGRGL